MQAYTGFAEVYEEFMDNIPYDEWAEYLKGLLEQYGVKEGLVCELGCGTGSMTRRLKSYGYDMIGIDNSAEMLDVAREYEMYEYIEEEEFSEYEEKSGDASEYDGNEFENAGAYSEFTGILYLLQDMREFELYGTVAAVVSVCDSMNYITEYEELVQVFKLVNNYLDSEGVFIFDLKTEHYYKNVLGDTTIAENRKECSFIWENSYFEDRRLNQYEMTIYKKADIEFEDEDGNTGDLYTRVNELHTQRAYTTEEVVRALAEADMEFVAAYDAFTTKPVREDSERIYIVARERHQDNKKYEYY